MFDVLTALDQLDELARVTRYPKIRARLPPAIAGRLVNDMRKLTVMVHELPAIAVCADAHDNYLLGIARAGHADFLVTGDKRDVLVLRVFDGTRIMTVRDFLHQIKRLP